MPYSEFEDSFGDTSYSDQLLRLDQTCERSHLDGWFCPSELFFCPSLVGILPEGAFCPQGLSNSLSNPGSIHGIGPRGPPIVLTVSRLFPVVTCPVDASSLSLLSPSKQATTHFIPTTSTRWPLSFFPTTIISILCLCVCTVLVSPALSSNCYSLLELCICLT